MPQTLVALRSVQVKDQLELVRIVIDVACDGTNNSVVGVQRFQQAVSRSNTNAELRRDLTLVGAQYAITDFAAAVQTGLLNFANALDIKP